MKKIYNQGDFKNGLLASVYDELPLWSAPFGLRLLETVDYSSNVIALDIGCGTGFPLLELAQRFGPESQFYGIDPWSEGLDRLRLKMDLYEIDNVAVSCATAEKLNFRDGMFNLITSNNGLNNVASFEEALSECHRTLKEGGRLVFTTNLPATFSIFYDAFSNILKEEGKYSILPLLNAHIRSKRKSCKEILTALKKSGFRKIRVNRRSFSLRFASGNSFLNHFLVRLYFINSWLSLIPEEDQSLIMKKTEEKLNSLAERNSGLMMQVPFAIFIAEKD